MLSLNPPANPIANPAPPSDLINIGRIGIIISLLTSFKKLTIPSRSILTPSPFRYRSGKAVLMLRPSSIVSHQSSTVLWDSSSHLRTRLFTLLRGLVHILFCCEARQIRRKRCPARCPAPVPHPLTESACCIRPEHFYSVHPSCLPSACSPD